MPGPVHAAKAVLDVPDALRGDARLPRVDRPLGVIGVQHLSPAEVRTLLLGHPDQPQERLAGVDVAPVRGADPHAVIDRFSDGPVEALGVPEGLLCFLARADVVPRRHAARDSPLGVPDWRRVTEQGDWPPFAVDLHQLEVVHHLALFDGPHQREVLFRHRRHPVGVQHGPLPDDGLDGKTVVRPTEQLTAVAAHHSDVAPGRVGDGDPHGDVLHQRLERALGVLGFLPGGTECGLGALAFGDVADEDSGPPAGPRTRPAPRSLQRPRPTRPGAESPVRQPASRRPRRPGPSGASRGRGNQGARSREPGGPPVRRRRRPRRGVRRRGWRTRSVRRRARGWRPANTGRVADSGRPLRAVRGPRRPRLRVPVRPCRRRTKRGLSSATRPGRRHTAAARLLSASA